MEVGDTVSSRQCSAFLPTLASVLLQNEVCVDAGDVAEVVQEAGRQRQGSGICEPGPEVENQPGPQATTPKLLPATLSHPLFQLVQTYRCTLATLRAQF